MTRTHFPHHPLTSCLTLQLVSPLFRLFAGSTWWWRLRERQRPVPRDLQPSSPSASILPQRLPRVGPGRHCHPSVPQWKPPDQPAAAGRHPLHPVFLPALAQPHQSQLSGFLWQPGTRDQGHQQPEGVLTLTWAWTVWTLSSKVWEPQKQKQPIREDTVDMQHVETLFDVPSFVCRHPETMGNQRSPRKHQKEDKPRTEGITLCAWASLRSCRTC